MQSLYGVQASEAARVWAGEVCGRHCHVQSTIGRKKRCVQPWFRVEPSLALINPNINHEHQGARAAAMAAEHASPRMV